MSSKNTPDEDYFARLDAEKKAKLREKLEREDAEKAAQKLKHDHWNKCGRCGHDMHPQLFKAVEIDLCGNCGAVLLDPGELEQLAGTDAAGTALKGLAEFFSFARRKKT